ncbi:hypothetical protein COCON_G00101960 [Conger conger]|uniref:Peptidase S1 domain-containing protein n=1 Tax=Conger conger TaxID=82655 RepID=A0A9Q1DHQ5_CONCO|nr:hypothetical protein COCON_G00101960 [Conger conger]
MQFPAAALLLVLCVGFAHASARRGGEGRSKRAIGGRVALNVPWQALVHFADGVLDGGIGGGALVSDRWVLTSGRNVFQKKPRHTDPKQVPDIPKIYLGVKNRHPVDPASEVEVEKVVLHPGFQNISTWENNLALIKLKKPVVFSSKILPIPLPRCGQNLEETVGTLGVFAGWGWSQVLQLADHLKFLNVPVVSQELCQHEYKHGGEVDSDEPLVDGRTFCTGVSAEAWNVCVGDEGGALAVLDPKDGTVYAAGLLSYDKNCATEKYGVFTKLSAYMPWIDSVMRGDSELYDAQRALEVRKMLANLKED